MVREFEEKLFDKVNEDFPFLFRRLETVRLGVAGSVAA